MIPRQDRPFSGAFFGCDYCGGAGEILTDTTRHFDLWPSERSDPCPVCEGFGTVWIEGASEIEDTQRDEPCET